MLFKILNNWIELCLPIIPTLLEVLNINCQFLFQELMFTNTAFSLYHPQMEKPEVEVASVDSLVDLL